MSVRHHQLQPEAFERLREQLATAIALCDDDQILSLADGLHDALRRRRAARYGEARGESRSWAPVGETASP
ncbi:MAG: hypothetical protein EON95_10205 [Caulobacteraceae bacterium]|nr:MAG: hypothetical protein EON95_10205 [Caulobacteraceae bacterium]